MNEASLSREELAEKISEIEFWPEIRSWFDNYLNQYVQSKDIEMVKLLLEAGANPNPKEGVDCYIHYLYHEYKVTKSSAGGQTLKLMKILLEGGANPNRVWCNNYRTYDYSIYEGIKPISELLEKYGVDQELRQYI